jgi:hypothetical protein
MSPRKIGRPSRAPRPPKQVVTGGVSPPPPAPGNTYTIRLYDYCNVYSPYVLYAANYYAGWMESLGLGIDVQYIRGAVLDYATCWGGNPNPTNGIKHCENLAGAGTAGSTGMHWVKTGPTAWELNSDILYEAEDWDYLYTCIDCGGLFTPGGQYLSVHEMGHSLANLNHRAPEDHPYSAMSSYGSYAPPYLIQFEKDLIIAALPTNPLGMAESRGITRGRSQSFVACNLPPPTAPGISPP